MSRLLAFIVCTFLLLGDSDAFAPQRVTFKPASLVQGSTLQRNRIFRMSEDGQASTEEKPEEKKVMSAPPTSGTYYDDEVEPVAKQGISDAMRERLMREASTGLNSDEKQTNVILYIMIGVAVLALLGGGGILY